MKAKIFISLAPLVFVELLSGQNYLPSSYQSVGNNRLGINLAAAPSAYNIEVGGGIGIAFGHNIGVYHTQWKKMIEPNWSGTPGVGDFVSFYVPGGSGSLNGLEKMRITNNGRLSIGNEPAPEAVLQVKDLWPLGQNAGDNQLLSSFHSDVVGNRIKANLWAVRDYQGANWQNSKFHDAISVDGTYNSPSVNTLTFWERYPYQDIQAWGNQNKTHMQLAQGRLGINKANPGAQLDVQETSGAIPTFISRAYHGGNFGYSILSNVSQDFTKAFAVIHRDFHTANSNEETFVVFGNGQTFIKSDVADAFMVEKTGSNPAINFKVKTDGRVFCRELEVMTGTFPDYVFKNDYCLMSVPEVEDFIVKNGHLPGMEKAEYYIENGIKTSEMLVKQMEKIEELTLYIIALEKKVNVLQEKSGR